MRVNYYDLDKNLYLYKNYNLYLSNDENTNKQKGRLIFSLNTSSSDVYDIINSNLFIKQFVKGYFYPYKTEKLASCRGRKVDTLQDVKYKEMDVKSPNITFKRIKLDLYGGYNTYFDTYGYYKVFEETYKSYKSFESKLKPFIPFLKEILGKTNSYSEVFIQVIPKELITTGRIFSFENILYFMLKQGTFDYEFFKKYKFVFSDKNNTRMFLVDFSDPKFSLAKFKKLSNILYKISNGIELDKEEEAEIQNSDNQIVQSSSKVLSVTNKQSSEKIKNLQSKQVKADIAKPIKNKIVKGLKLTDKIALNTDDLELLDRIEKTIDNKATSFNNVDELEDELNNDERFLNYLVNLKNNQTTVPENKLERLKEKQNKVDVNIKVSNKPLNIDNILHDHEVHSINTETININTLNEEVKTCTLKELDRNYVKNQKDKDLIKVLSAFNNDPECPIYITDLSREDISDEINKKELIKVNYEDGWGNRHIVNIEMPIIYDNSFMYLNDHKVSIGKQLMKLPITKNKPNEVSISTDKGKMFFWRFNSKLSSNSDKLKNFILKDAPSHKGKISVKLGNCVQVNSKYSTLMEYDEVSRYMLSFDYNRNVMLCFNRDKVNAEISEFLDRSIDDSIPEGEYLLGVNKVNGIIYTINVEDGLIHSYNSNLNEALKLQASTTYTSIFNLVLSIFKQHEETELYKKLLNQKVSSKFMYVRTKVTGTMIPLIILTGFYFGLENVMLRYGIEYEFSEKKKQLDDDDVSLWSSIRFADGYLNYKSTPLRNSLLMNGLNDIPFLKETEFAAMNEKGIYIEYFDLRYGKRNLAKGFQNTLNFLLDPKTKEILDYMKLPNDLLGVLLHCNTLLSDNSYVPVNDMKNYRLRSIETVNATLYDVLSEAVREYKDAYKSGYTDRKISLHSPDAVIKKLVESPIVEAYSTLSPVLEIERLGSTTYKGIGGTNLDDAFTPQMRSYDQSMVGLLGISSPDSNKVGVTRQLSYNPKVTNNFGFIDTNTNVQDLAATNMLTAGELLSCYTSLHADPPRIGMQTQQAKHSVPTEKQSRPLYGSGIERTLPYTLSSDFVSIAEQDGVVEKVDTKNELVIIRYKDGTTDVIDISERISKNSNGG